MNIDIAIEIEQAIITNHDDVPKALNNCFIQHHHR